LCGKLCYSERSCRLFLVLEWETKNILLAGVKMLAALTPENQIASILDSIGCVPSNFSEIADRHANSRVIQALKGTNDFDPEDGQYYLGLAIQMKRLAEEFPVPIDWRKTQRIKEILATRKAEGQPIPFSVILIGPLLFNKIEAGRIETTSSYQECAAFADRSVAFAAARILAENMGQIGVRHTTITNERRAPETFVSKLADLGFESK
jgi:hypothetical protein